MQRIIYIYLYDSIINQYKNTKTMKMRKLTLVLGVLFMGGVLAASMTSCGNADNSNAAAGEEQVDQATTSDEGAAVEEATETKAEEAVEEAAEEATPAEATPAEAAPAEDANATEVEAPAENEAPAAEEAPEAPAETEKCGK
jgi:hypothetical protein